MRVAQHQTRLVVHSWERAARGTVRSFVKGIAAFAAAFAFIWNVDGNVRWFALGAYSVGVLWLLAWALSLSTGTGSQIRGILAERWTASVLAPRRARRQGWRVVHGLYFAGHGDVDHVLIGPGGVWAVESKWTSEPAAIENDTLVGPWTRPPLQQARDSAQRVDRALRLTKARVAVEPRPLLVLWGPGAPNLRADAQTVDGVRVLSRPDRRDVELILADGSGLDPERMERAWNERSDFAKRQASHGQRPRRTRRRRALRE